MPYILPSAKHPALRLPGTTRLSLRLSMAHSAGKNIFLVSHLLSELANNIKIINSKTFLDFLTLFYEKSAGYEGQKIYLIEAKMGQIGDFLIRQLYYPYRMWHLENISKEVIPIFINYANNTISISQYTFDNFNVYSSISPIKCERFSFDENPLKFDLLQILQSTKKELQEPNIPFPQADDITKVIDTIDLISWGYNSKQSIAKFWQIDLRQADYYTNAASYLGFIYKKDNRCWNLTSKGNEFVNYPTTKRNYLLCSAILSKPVFNEIGTSYLDKGKIMPDKQSICDVLQNYVQLSDTTPPRRVQTIKSWIDYLGNLDNTVSY